AKQGWYKAGSNWQYYKDGIALTGWHDDIPGWEGQWFYFDAISGTFVMQTGWLQIGNEFYYLNESGVMQTGWQFIAWSGGTDWFYFDDNGIMLRNTTTPDGYYVDENGRLSEPDTPSDDPSEPGEPAKQGWYKAGSNWQYYKDGKALTGWQNDIPGWEGQWFYFDAINGTGIMQTGWLQIGNEFYYLSESGVMQTGWQFIAWSDGADWFYFSESGLMLKNTTTPDGYYVDENGVWRS
ncbi:MAG: hypothetical protein Q4B14_00575, partial [Clostridia bacterium]|nr:hypothetical protein [Clostridia bacterium]